MNFLLMQTNLLNSPIWIALITSIGTIIAALLTIGGGYLAYRYTRPKTQAEITGQKISNQKAQLENFDYTNEVFENAKEIIKKYQLADLEKQSRIHELEGTVSIRKLEVERANGKLELVLGERETALIEIAKLQKEHLECIEHNDRVDRKLIELTYNNTHLNDRLNIIVGLMQKGGFAVPEEFQWILQPIPNVSNQS